jgi:hypothetical protein
MLFIDHLNGTISVNLKEQLAATFFIKRPQKHLITNKKSSKKNRIYFHQVKFLVKLIHY